MTKALRSKWEKAWQRFARFHERSPKEGELVTIQLTGKPTAFLVGDLEGVIYRTRDDGQRYVHEFNKSARPVLYVTDDGKQIYVLAGAYSFTDRGFEDRKRRRKK